MSFVSRLLEDPRVYRLHQAPFAEAKLAPVLRHNDLRTVRRVLDVACGPGTNTAHFGHADYVGLDVNERYIAAARRRHHRTFLVADVTAQLPPLEGRFDCVLLNSLLHHMSDADARGILQRLRGVLAEDGHVHVLDLVLPDDRGIARLLARLDRGAFARPLAGWRRILGEVLEPVVCEPYGVGLLGRTLWNMVYVKGRARA